MQGMDTAGSGFDSAIWGEYRDAWLHAQSGRERMRVNVAYRPRLWAAGLMVLNLTLEDQALLRSMRICWD